MSASKFQTHLKLGLDASGKCRIYSNSELHDSCLSGRASSFRIALVKQDCYQDLWIGNSSDSPIELLLSTQMRVGPLALLSDFEADFHIVHLEEDPTVQMFRSQAFLEESVINKIRKTRYCTGSIQSDLNKSFEKLALRKHSDYSKQASDIDWGRYHMVMSINASVSRKLRKKFPRTVWITIPGEGSLTYGCLQWDYCVTHNCPTSLSVKSKFLDIPYTFLHPTEIKDVIQELGFKSSERETIYLEINSCPVHIRPPTFEGSCYAQELQATTGLPVRIHPNTMDGHLKELAVAKYFIKTGGRPTRGNSILEAISAGVVVLLRVGDCFGNVDLPVDSYFEDLDGLLVMLRRLEADPHAYRDLLVRQNEFISRTYFYSLSLLSEAYNEKKYPRCSAQLRRFCSAFKSALKYNLARSAKDIYSWLRPPFWYFKK